MQIARPIPCKVWVIIGNLMMDRVPDFRVPGISQNMGLRQVEQGSSSFFAKFLAYLMIFQSFKAPLCRIIKYTKHLAKNEEKSRSSCLKPISPRYFQNP